MSKLLQGSKNGKKKSLFILTDDTKAAFKAFKEAFTKAPVLLYFGPNKPIHLETDSSGFALKRILSQLGEEPADPELLKYWHLVAFWSQKKISAERNYETHD